MHNLRCKEQWRRIVCTRSILIEHSDNIILSNFCLAGMKLKPLLVSHWLVYRLMSISCPPTANHEETEINYTCDKTTLHRLICTRGTRKDKRCSRHKWFGRSKCPDTDTEQLKSLHEGTTSVWTFSNSLNCLCLNNKCTKQKHVLNACVQWKAPVDPTRMNTVKCWL